MMEWTAIWILLFYFTGEHFWPYKKRAQFAKEGPTVSAGCVLRKPWMLADPWMSLRERDGAVFVFTFED